VPTEKRTEITVMKKLIGVILILAICCNLTAFSVSAVDDPRVEVVIDTKDNPLSISPYIYGIADNDGAVPIRVNSIKQTGTDLALYNWERNYSNDGRVNLIPGTTAGSPGMVSTAFYPASFLQNAEETEYRYVTLPSAGYAAADENGVVIRGDLSRFYPIIGNKATELLTEPDITDGVVYTDEYLAYLVNHFGYAIEGGIAGYFLDREPETHRSLFPFLMLPNVTAANLTTEHISAAKTIKRIDSSALVMGPSVKNLEAYVNLGNTNDWNSHSTEWDWFVDYYLAGMSLASEDAGMRLLDVLDLHYYTEAAAEGGTTVLTSEAISVREAREAAPRIFWDATYNESSKSSLSFKSKTPLIPTLKASVGIYYPGTEISFSEYAFGGGGDISGGIAAADALGIFGRYGVYSANMVTSDLLYNGIPDYEYAALKLFTDYDGEGGAFGSTSVGCDLGSDRMGSGYAATEGGDPNLTVVYMNKNLEEAQTVMFSLYSDADYETAEVYGFNAESSEVRHFSDFDINGNTFTVKVPAQTVFLFKITGKLREGIITTIVTDDKGETMTEIVEPPENPTTSTIDVTTIPDEIITAPESGFVSHIPAEGEQGETGAPLFLKVIVIAVAAAVVISIIWVLINLRKL
jgi:mannan endo-1,4-beta-mannosidase